MTTATSASMAAKSSTAEIVSALTLVVSGSLAVLRCLDLECLFDLRLDPEERVNRAGEGSLEVAWLRSRLLAWIERGRYLEMNEEEPQLDDETRQRLRALGYLD